MNFFLTKIRGRMVQFRKNFRSAKPCFCTDDKGATNIEYAILAAMAAFALMASGSFISTSLDSVFGDIAAELSGDDAGGNNENVDGGPGKGDQDDEGSGHDNGRGGAGKNRANGGAIPK